MRINELESVLKETLDSLPSLASSDTRQSFLYHDLYIKIWNVLEGYEEVTEDLQMALC